MNMLCFSVNTSRGRNQGDKELGTILVKKKKCHPKGGPS